jgi:hypothetical protein
MRLSMGGQPWSKLELHGQPWWARRRGRTGGAMGRGAVGGEGAMGTRPCCSVRSSVFCTWEKARRRKEKGEEKEKEGKEKKKYGKKFQTWKFSRRKKTIYEVGKIYFLKKERYMPNYK